MKKTLSITVTAVLIFLFSCNDEVDDSQYLDKDPNCYVATPGTCCDVDGRILVFPTRSYNYTYKGNKKTSKIVWSVLSGSIEIKDGQGTGEARFYFKKDFTKGQIAATGLIDGAQCQSIIEISKL